MTYSGQPGGALEVFVAHCSTEHWQLNRLCNNTNALIANQLQMERFGPNRVLAYPENAPTEYNAPTDHYTEQHMHQVRRRRIGFESRSGTPGMPKVCQKHGEEGRQAPQVAEGTSTTPRLARCA